MFEQCSGQHHDPCGPISNFVVLALGQFHHKAGHGVLYFHFFDNGGTVVGDSDLLVGGDEEFVQSLGAQRGSQSGGY